LYIDIGKIKEIKENKYTIHIPKRKQVNKNYKARGNKRVSYGKRCG
jgi:hypothetical protein